MSVEELLRQYLPKVNIMQLATSVNDQPWICTVHFYSDDDLNFYWCSTLERRHSKEIKQNQKIASYVLVHENTQEENYVIGVSVEGTAEYIGEQISEDIGNAYVEKLHKDPNLIRDIKAGKSPHMFYRLKPTNVVMFNTKDFTDNPRQEWKPNA